MSYRIIVTPDAEADMKELRDYIADVLHAPAAALSYLRTVRGEIASLTDMPARYRLMDEEPWHSYGLRRAMARNSYIYFPSLW